ncbi:hypothetical protein [Micromonospora sp. CA-246542]|uniref:hypothetical protein n=1 Tax=Micromonospora sp. CA-246542 TaxID=3239959 RepID=UPI003D8EFFCA
MSTDLTATDLDEWSRRRDAEGHLPTLVRKLIMASVRPDRIRIPAAEGVALPGLDGVVTVAGGSPPYVPSGTSVWEMGTNQNPKSKAKKDYAKRTKDTLEGDRAGATFVFVTSRTWNQSAVWVDETKELEDGWKDVVVLDAQDLTTWLESCPGVQAWLAEHVGRGPIGVTGLADWFTHWSEQTMPTTPAGVLIAGRTEAGAQLLDQLAGPPQSIGISAGSLEEAVAFAASALLQLDAGPSAGPGATGELVAQAVTLGGDVPQRRQFPPEEREALIGRCVVIEDVDGWRRWSNHEAPHILIPMFVPGTVTAALAAGHHVLLPSVARTARSAGRLAPIDIDSACTAWEAAGAEPRHAAEFARASRRNLGSLRRRINRHGHRQNPAWATGTSASLLAAALLAGEWNATAEGDVSVLLELTDRASWRGLARDLTMLTVGEDAPLAENDSRWEFTDVIDAWESTGSYLTAEDLEVFTRNVPVTLTEPDPALGVPMRDQLAMLVDDNLPQRRYSRTLQRGIATTLAVLGSVIGGRVVAAGRTGQEIASASVRELLAGADAERWLVLADLLPLLAEAAPEVFLDALEQSLRQPDPPVLALFEETTGSFGPPSSRHSPLLWALETLGFSTALVSRVSVALARLTLLDPGGRLANRPDESLTAMLHLRVPQSAINAATRLEVLDAIRRTVPLAATNLMISLIGSVDRGLLIRHGPRYRDWPVPRAYSAVSTALRAVDDICGRLIDDVPGDEWAKVAALLGRVTPASRTAIVAALDTAWEDLGEHGAGVLAAVAEVADLHRHHPDADWAMTPSDLALLDTFLTGHGAPPSQVSRAAVFSWMPEGTDITTAQGRAEAARRRTEVVHEAAGAGVRDIAALAREAELPRLVGATLAATTGDLDDPVLDLLASDDPQERELASGLAQVRARTQGWAAAQLRRRPESAARLLLSCDLTPDTLDLLTAASPEQQLLFWSQVPPYQAVGDVLERFCDGLITAGRPLAAITALSGPRADNVATELALRVLQAPMAATRQESDSSRSLEYEVGRLLDQVRDACSFEDELIRLELFYMPLLAGQRRPTALYRKMAADPEFFADVVSYVYTPDATDATGGSENDTDDGAGNDDAPEPESQFSESCFRLLRGWHDPLPTAAAGSAPNAEALQTWTNRARTALTARRRAGVASLAIGAAVAGPATDEDGTWPCLAVRALLEQEQDGALEDNLLISRINQRGATVRGAYTGGRQERVGAAQYRTWADSVRHGWPRAGALLDRLAGVFEAEGRREDSIADRRTRQ